MEKRIRKIIADMNKIADYDISASVSRDKIVTLNGTALYWKQVVDAGHKVANVKGVRNVVNDMISKDIKPNIIDYSKKIKEVKNNSISESCDVVIIGAGISGCAIARNLSKYNLNVMVVEKNSDIAEEATKANNGNIHPGVLAKPGTLKAKLNLRGNEMYTKLSEELDFELKRTGSLLVFYNKKDVNKFKILKFLKYTGIGKLIKPLSQAMKVPGMKWLNTKEVRELEPNLKGEPIGGFLLTTMGLVEPFEVCSALAENAAENGVTFKFNTQVIDIVKEKESIKEVITNHSTIKCQTVINCAGVYADNIAKMVDDCFYTIHARRGAIAIIDKNRKGYLNTPVGLMSDSDRSNNSKGGGASVTPEGNLLWGPNAVEVYDKEDKSVDAVDMDYIIKLGRGVTDEVKKSEIITYFAGIRAADYKEDFIVEASRKVDGFIHVAGIQSPGLASAPAIAEMVEEILFKQNSNLEIKSDYNPIRVAKPKFRDLSHEEQDKLIKKNPKYGNIVCRCELITEGEIIDAVHSPIPATTIDAIKRRSRAGMGRCQGGFCGPRVLEIIARELEIPLTKVTLKGENSYVLHRQSRV